MIDWNHSLIASLTSLFATVVPVLVPPTLLASFPSSKDDGGVAFVDLKKTIHQYRIRYSSERSTMIDIYNGVLGQYGMGCVYAVMGTQTIIGQDHTHN